MIHQKKILVTGAAGFVGSNLIRQLINDDNQVLALVYPGEDTHRLKGLAVSLCPGDLTRPETLIEPVTGVDYIFHLGAQLGGVDDELFYLVNHMGTCNLVHACLLHNPTLKRFLYVSSTTVHGPSGRNGLLNESAPYCPVGHYGRSKQLAEEFLISTMESLPWTIVRLPLVYGPGSLGGIFSVFALAEYHLKPIFGPGELNVCHVEDAVNGMIRAAANEKSLGQSYILAEPVIYSSAQILKVVGACVGKWRLPLLLPYPLMYALGLFCEMVVKVVGGNPWMTRHSAVSYLKHRYWRFDVRKAIHELGFSPRYSLREGVKQTYRWYKQNGYL